MKQDIAKLWCEELRSGKHKQGVGALRTDDDRFCCLGVLCKMYSDKTGVPWLQSAHGDSHMSIHEATGALPDEVMEWAGMQSKWGELRNGVYLSSKNDRGAYFPEIADMIEKDAEYL